MPKKKTTGNAMVPARANAAKRLPLPRSYSLAGTAIQPTQIFAIPERHPRGRGPWVGEPDRVAWRDAVTGLDCLLLRQVDGTLSGFVSVPPSHPLSGYSYDAVPAGVRAVPHRGLSYSAECDQSKPEAISVCHVESAPQRAAVPSAEHVPHGADASWWFGFETDHPGDFVPKGPAPYRAREEGEQYRDINYVAAETMKFAFALKALDTSGAPIEPVAPLPLGAPHPGSARREGLVMMDKQIPYEKRRNPNLPWDYWCIAEEGKPGVRDEYGEEWASLRSYLWFSRLGMGGSSNYGLEAQLELLLAVLASLARGVVAVEGLAKDLLLGGWEATRHYECWLVGHRLVKNGLSGGLTPEGYAILIMLSSTRSAKAAPIPIGLPTIAPVRALDRGDTLEERERVFAANEAFARGLPDRFERAVSMEQPAIRLIGHPEGRNVPMTRVLWSLPFREDHDRDRLFAWLVNRIDRWQDWAEIARREGAQQLSEHLLQLAHADRPALDPASAPSPTTAQTDNPSGRHRRCRPQIYGILIMRRLLLRDIPERMVVLSILPPPAAGQHLAPFGWGSLTVTAGRRGQASFTARCHGYGAGYHSERMRHDLQRLLRPDDAMLLYLPVPQFDYGDRRRRLILPREQERMIPRSGSRNTSVVAIPHHAITDAASLAQVIVPPRFPTPLARLLRVSAEAQAAWVYWIYSCCAPRLRRDLLASFNAWQVLGRSSRAA